MIKGIGGRYSAECAMNFGTHNGIFHCDEVVGIAILDLVYNDIDTYIVRTRNLDELKKLDIVIDVGGGMFDHHISGFNVRRTSGVKYASAGLVWKEYAEKAIRSVMNDEKMYIDYDDIEMIKKQIDEEIIVKVDMEDNGEEAGTHLFSFITEFLPSWTENSDYDGAFHNVESIVVEVLRKIIKNKIVQIMTSIEIRRRLTCVDDGILEIPAQNMPWIEEVVLYNRVHNYNVKFVVFPYPAGGYAAQSVPPSIEKKFEQLVSFPQKWAGGNEYTLPQITGIKDATFCHNGCFFVRAKTKKAIIEMCKLAMD